MLFYLKPALYLVDGNGGNYRIVEIEKIFLNAVREHHAVFAHMRLDFKIRVSANPAKDHFSSGTDARGTSLTRVRSLSVSEIVSVASDTENWERTICYH